jgi:Saxitoxin biosynthesis operon protein SxtJ
MAHTAERPSDRSFGFLWTAVFAVLGAWPLASGERPRIGLFVVAGVLALISVVAPILLRPLNIIWHRFGLLLSKVLSPVVLGAMFFVVFAPLSWALRLFGKNLLERRKPDRPTYWLQRAASRGGTLQDQF